MPTVSVGQTQSTACCLVFRRLGDSVSDVGAQCKVVACVSDVICTKIQTFSTCLSGLLLAEQGRYDMRRAMTPSGIAVD